MAFQAPEKMRAVVFKGDYDVQSHFTPSQGIASLQVRVLISANTGCRGRPTISQAQEPDRRDPQSHLDGSLRQRPALLSRTSQVPAELHLRTRVCGRDRGEGRWGEQVQDRRQGEEKRTRIYDRGKGY